MPEKDTQVAVPPPLKAIGGWTDAEWFSAAVLSDDEVVGFTLPKLAGTRKQVFRLVERASPAAARGKAPQKTPAPPARSISARLGQTLEGYGVTKAAAFGRSRLLYDPAPTLFFAEMPTKSLKARAANTLRQELIQIGLRGCIVHIGRTHLIAMFWSCQESEITGFVEAASPPWPLHVQFDQADDARLRTLEAPRQGAPDQPLGAKERKRLHAEREALVREVNALRVQVEQLQKTRSARGAMEQLGLDDARLRSMLILLHPDKHGNSEAATEAAKWVNGLRDLLKSK